MITYKIKGKNAAGNWQDCHTFGGSSWSPPYIIAASV